VQMIAREALDRRGLGARLSIATQNAAGEVLRF
jgi:hypothetical protein